jgi:hypothetical protein
VQIGPPPAPVPPPIVNTTVTVQAPPPDPQAIADASVESSQAIIMTVIAPPPIEWANDMLNLPDFWRTTPANLTYEHPAVVQLLSQMREHAFALIALAILAVGISVAIGKYSGYGGRVVFAVVAAMGSLIWWQLGIELNNIICAAIGAPDLPSIVKPQLSVTFNPGDHVGTIVLTVVYAVVTLMLMFSLIVRIVLIDVLLVAAPLALILYATPQSESIAQRYTGLAVGLLFSQVLVVIGLKLVAAFSAPGVGGTLMAIAVLLTLRRLPGLLSQLSQQQPAGYSVVRSEVSRRLVRAVARR